MLNAIKDFFERKLSPGGSEQDEVHRLRLAVAALLLEMTRMDPTLRAEECAWVEEAVRERFELTPEEARKLLDLAEAERKDATDYFQFTSLINRHYGPEERIAVVRELWRIAYSDATLHRDEEHLVRKLADLLHVPHSQLLAAKHQVLGEG
jgi:uncharacterized tellurite resistance protein B-like protein